MQTALPTYALDRLSALRAPTPGSGVALGLACAGAVALGVGPALACAALALLVVVDWIGRAPGEAERLRGLGVGALVGLAAAKGLLSGPGWSEAGCSAFSAEPWRVAVLLAAVPSLLAVADEVFIDRSQRSAAAALAVGIAVIAAGVVAPGCFA